MLVLGETAVAQERWTRITSQINSDKENYTPCGTKLLESLFIPTVNKLRDMLRETEASFSSQKDKLQTEISEMKKRLAENAQQQELLKQRQAEEIESIRASYQNQIRNLDKSTKSSQDQMEKVQQEFESFKASSEVNKRTLLEQVIEDQNVLAEKNREWEKIKKEIADKEAQHLEIVHKTRMQVNIKPFDHFRNELSCYEWQLNQIQF